MQVKSLVGVSGTGKSYRALLIAKENDIEHLIDDGLFIKGNKIIAGSSAKKEPTKIAAVRRALFMDQGHRNEVIKAIEDHNPDSILVLGTSDGMVDRITETLGIPAPETRFYIENIATRTEIELAKQQRHEQGKHIIPVPTLEVKKDFSGYFLDTLKIFSKKRDDSVIVDEKTVVRPTYSYLGKYTIYRRAIVHIVKIAAGKAGDLIRICNAEVIAHPYGIVLNIDIDVRYGIIMGGPIAQMRNAVKSEIERITSLNVLAVNVLVKGFIPD